MHQLQLLRTGDRFAGLEPGDLAPDERESVLRLASGILESMVHTGNAFTSPEIAKRYFQAKLATRPDEVFGVLYLDNRNRAIEFREMFHGTVDGCSVHPRTIVRTALELNSAALVLAHNHPSGATDPSTADQRITQRLKD